MTKDREAELEAQVRELTSERDRLKAALLWALTPVVNKYRPTLYWRLELARRAGINMGAVKGINKV